MKEIAIRAVPCRSVPAPLDEHSANRCGIILARLDNDRGLTAGESRSSLDRRGAGRTTHAGPVQGNLRR